MVNGIDNVFYLELVQYKTVMQALFQLIFPHIYSMLHCDEVFVCLSVKEIVNLCSAALKIFDSVKVVVSPQTLGRSVLGQNTLA